MENHYNREIAAAAQIEYAAAHDCPMFAPKNGWCWHCGNNIYDPMKTKSGVIYGYSVEYAEEHLIISCPFCKNGFTN